MLKIFCNRTPVVGPWGGGNRFITALYGRAGVNYEIVMPPSALNAILCVDVRNSHASLGGFSELKNAKDLLNLNIPIILRVGDIGSHGKPELFDLVSKSVVDADAVIFTSAWARDEIINVVGHIKNVHVIPNAPADLFYNHRRLVSVTAPRPRLVTHHWSNNKLKGFEMYQLIDRSYDFTFMGRTPDDVKLSKNLGHKDNIDEIAQTLSQFDVYVTASKYEAGANHVLEALAVGLPVVYDKDGGSIPEYVDAVQHDGGHAGFVSGDMASFDDALKFVVQNHVELQKHISCYNENIENVVTKYIKVIEETVETYKKIKRV